MKNKKKLLLAVIVIAGLFLLSGCTSPTDPVTKKVILITAETTFNSIMKSEGWFNAFFVFPLAKAMNYLAPILTVAGAVATVTFVVHLIVLAATFKSTLGQQKMQALQPEINKIQKKYEGKTDQDSKIKMSQEQQALYAKNGINMFGSLLSGFLQLPIMLAVFQAVQRADSVKYGNFFGASLETTPINGIMSGQMIYLLLILIMAALQFVSMKLPQWLANEKAKKEAEKHHTKYVEPKPAMGGNMTNMMMVMMVGFGVVMPSAMTIYYVCSSLVTICKTWFINQLFLKEDAKK